MNYDQFNRGSKVRAKRNIGSFVKAGEIYVVENRSIDFTKYGPKFDKIEPHIKICGDTMINPIYPVAA